MKNLPLLFASLAIAGTAVLAAASALGAGFAWGDIAPRFLGFAGAATTVAQMLADYAPRRPRPPARPRPAAIRPAAPAHDPLASAAFARFVRQNDPATYSL